KGKLIYLIAAAVIIVEIIVSELISLAIIAATYQYTLADVLGNPDVLGGIITDIALGLVLSGAVFGYYIFAANRKSKADTNNKQFMPLDNRGADVQPQNTTAGQPFGYNDNQAAVVPIDRLAITEDNTAENTDNADNTKTE
ncbi:MAG: hypothetical protein LBS99_02285, partial [Clostridiales bacterium]|nr:hypothetical protein [Clostridiales bacterium]